MKYPAFLILPSIEDYRKYYETKYCKKPIITFDGIPVYFSKSKFDHAFFESSKRNKIKDKFSTIRAQRMTWIAKTLTHPNAVLYQGWDKKRRRYDPRWRVNVVFDDYVVVLKITVTKENKLKGEFRTAYKAENSIGKIKASPKWHKDLVLK